MVSPSRYGYIRTERDFPKNYSFTYNPLPFEECFCRGDGAAYSRSCQCDWPHTSLLSMSKEMRDDAYEVFLKSRSLIICTFRRDSAQQDILGPPSLVSIGFLYSFRLSDLKHVR